MSRDIIRLSASDFGEAMAFLDGVFAEHSPHDFANLLPSIYQPTDEHMRCNYAVRDGGRLAAIVGVFPINWRVGGVPLKMAGIGGVSVHKDFRGKGYMKLLMNHAVEQMQKDGVDLSYLGGRRQRYTYFGYEVGGCKYQLKFNLDNVRHGLRGAEAGVTFEPFEDDSDSLSTLKNLHEAQPNYCERSEEAFARYVRSWSFKPRLARDEQGRVVGYVAANEVGDQVNELVARDPESARRIVGAWMQSTKLGLTLQAVGPIDPNLRALIGFAETTSTAPSGNWRIFNWQKVVDALIRAKQMHEPMPAGSVAVQIGDEQGPVYIRNVDEGGGGASDVLKLDPLAAVPLLFGPQSPASVQPLPESARMLAAWCPLPLGISPQDKV